MTDAEQFELGEAEFIPLDKLLKVTGVTDTGGMARVAVEMGEVRVDGQVELRKRCKIRRGQVVELAGVRIEVS